jgi:hypothetical protein
VIFPGSEADRNPTQHQRELPINFAYLKSSPGGPLPEPLNSKSLFLSKNICKGQKRAFSTQMCRQYKDTRIRNQGITILPKETNKAPILNPKEMEA